MIEAGLIGLVLIAFIVRFVNSGPAGETSIFVENK